MGTDNEIEMHFTVRVGSVGFEVGKHAVLKPGQIQAGQAARIVGVLAGVHHGETPVAFQQDRIGIIRVQKMDAVVGKQQISLPDRCNVRC